MGFEYHNISFVRIKMKTVFCRVLSSLQYKIHKYQYLDVCFFLEFTFNI